VSCFPERWHLYSKEMFVVFERCLCLFGELKIEISFVEEAPNTL